MHLKEQEMLNKNTYRDPKFGKNLIEAISKATTREWRIMETCGGQTYSIAKYGIEEMLPPQITLIHGPGCPVCVTPQYTIDNAIELSKDRNNIILSFGDMLRVRGAKDDLLTAKSFGGDIRVIYSPLEALKIAQENPFKEVIIFAIGFETTAPIHAQVVIEAERLGIKNISLLTALFAVPPILETLLEMPDFSVDGVLAAGHVCAITGLDCYDYLTAKYKFPISVTGFEPVDILWGIYNNILQLENGENNVFNAYSRMVTQEGNIKAMDALKQVFKIDTQNWRGLGDIKDSGYSLKNTYKKYNATYKFKLTKPLEKGAENCIAAKIMKGLSTPKDCPHFNKGCTPTFPMGAPMVSSEGVCAAFYTYKI